MRIEIGGNTYSTSRRILKGDTLIFLSVSPDPDLPAANIKMYRDDGFLISEDDVSEYLRYEYNGTTLTFTNKPKEQPTPLEPSLNSRVSDLEQALDMILTGVTEDDTGNETENPEFQPQEESN